MTGQFKPGDRVRVLNLSNLIEKVRGTFGTIYDEPQPGWCLVSLDVMGGKKFAFEYDQIEPTSHQAATERPLSVTDGLDRNGLLTLATRLREAIDNDHRATDQSERFKRLLRDAADALSTTADSFPAGGKSATAVHEMGVDANPYVVWSIEHKAWWGPNHAGYTTSLDKAGRYSREDAVKISNGRCWGWRVGEQPAEVPVLERDAIDLVQFNYWNKQTDLPAVKSETENEGGVAYEVGDDWAVTLAKSFRVSGERRDELAAEFRRIEAAGYTRGHIAGETATPSPAQVGASEGVTEARLAIGSETGMVARALCEAERYVSYIVNGEFAGPGSPSVALSGIREARRVFPSCATCEGQGYVNGAFCPGCHGAGHFGVGSSTSIIFDEVTLPVGVTEEMVERAWIKGKALDADPEIYPRQWYLRVLESAFSYQEDAAKSLFESKKLEPSSDPTAWEDAGDEARQYYRDATKLPSTRQTKTGDEA
jgi:hypothetical protein